MMNMFHRFKIFAWHIGGIFLAIRYCKVDTFEMCVIFTNYKKERKSQKETPQGEDSTRDTYSDNGHQVHHLSVSDKHYRRVFVYDLLARTNNALQDSVINENGLPGGRQVKSKEVLPLFLMEHYQHMELQRVDDIFHVQ